jgi:hypothetical protein
MHTMAPTESQFGMRSPEVPSMTVNCQKRIKECERTTLPMCRAGRLIAAQQEVPEAWNPVWDRFPCLRRN